MNRVSIIIPVYGTERYVRRCAESLFAQTYDNIEYIFIDDCTPDHAISAITEVLDAYPHRSSQVKTIRHERNMGVEESRISGIRAATGNYIAFTDSDDFIDRDMIETMLGKAVETDADIVVCDIMLESGSNRKTYLSDYVSPDPDDWLRDMIINGKSHGYLHNKLYRATLFSGIHFPMPRISYAEDWWANIQLCHAAKLIVHIRRAMYHYVTNSASSISKAKNSRHFNDTIIFWNRVECFIKQWNLTADYPTLIPQLKLRSKASLMLSVDNADTRRQFKAMFPECKSYENAIFNPELRKGERLTLWLLRHNLYHSIGLLRKILIWRSMIQSGR